MDRILARAAAGGRISRPDAVRLLSEAGLSALGRAAASACRRLHPGPFRTYALSRTISTTNVCRTRCRFCAFFRPADHPEAFALSEEEILARVGRAAADGCSHVMLQGGIGPGLSIESAERLLRAIHARFSSIHVHGFSPPEIDAMRRAAGSTLREILARLKAAGLGSVPGGGAEILCDRVRRIVSPRKIRASRWLAVMRAAHGLGLRTTATMVFGLGETDAERAAHLDRIRGLQDETGGFTAFIPWPFQPGRTALARRPWPTGAEFLRVLAVSRLFLDNVANVQASWLTVGPDIGSLALDYGANDMDSPVVDERVLAAAGTAHRMSREEIRAAIREAGFRPARRDCLYARTWEEA